jgi:hypothetical protein
MLLLAMMLAALVVTAQPSSAEVVRTTGHSVVVGCDLYPGCRVYVDVN